MLPYIETASGTRFWYDTDGTDDIFIEDIAAHLSKLCRFTGACRRFYSVAEHSIYVSALVPPEKALAGLLHDASEAYLADIASPVKQLLPDYRELERQVMERVGHRFGLAKGFENDVDVKLADWAQLRSEAMFLLPTQGEGWSFPEECLKLDAYLPQGLDSQVIEKLFMERYKQLTGEFK